jgi:hypothetical protein
MGFKVVFSNNFVNDLKDITSYISRDRGRPGGFWAGRIGAIRAPASSVKFVSYRSWFSNTHQLQTPSEKFRLDGRLRSVP